MKNDLFLDTSALIALLNKKDQYHEDLQNYLQSMDRPFSGVTSNLVLGEFLTFFSRYGGFKEAQTFHEKILEDPSFRILWVGKELHNLAAETLGKFADQKISFTDASSFAIMKREHLTTALAFDEDFVKAGFLKLP